MDEENPIKFLIDFAELKHLTSSLTSDRHDVKYMQYECDYCSWWFKIEIEPNETFNARLAKETEYNKHSSWCPLMNAINKVKLFL